jgi:hypothetical protein
VEPPVLTDVPVSPTAPAMSTISELQRLHQRIRSRSVVVSYILETHHQDAMNEALVDLVHDITAAAREAELVLAAIPPR